jgi:hypothetical protein
VDVTGERIGMAETGMAPALRTLDMMQGSSRTVAAGHAEGEHCAQSEAATSEASLSGKNLPARAGGSRDPGRKTGVEAIRDLPPRGGF